MFGRATIAMPALSRPPAMGSSPSAPAVDASIPGLDLPAAPVNQTPMMPPPGDSPASGSNMLLWALAGIIALLAIVLIAITLSIVMG
ncbi:MAG: hypothetical protein CMH57_07440 [Myxococcales bacterium]|nr:hypothetical protein [Myxococcales bacterium]